MLIILVIVRRRCGGRSVAGCSCVGGPRTTASEPYDRRRAATSRSRLLTHRGRVTKTESGGQLGLVRPQGRRVAGDPRCSSSWSTSSCSASSTRTPSARSRAGARRRRSRSRRVDRQVRPRRAAAAAVPHLPEEHRHARLRRLLPVQPAGPRASCSTGSGRPSCWWARRRSCRSSSALDRHDRRVEPRPQVRQDLDHGDDHALLDAGVVARTDPVLRLRHRLRADPAAVPDRPAAFARASIRRPSTASSTRPGTWSCPSSR